MSTTTPEQTTDAPGEHLVQELQWIHGKLRRDLGILEALSERVNQGATPDTIRDEIATLQTTSPLWKLRVNCLTYCRFTHMHHGAEDVSLFPALRAFDPALESVVDRLEGDHRLVSTILDQIEAAAGALASDDTIRSRGEVVGALGALSNHLIAHLDYEEAAISPTLRQWHTWPQMH